MADLTRLPIARLDTERYRPLRLLRPEVMTSLRRSVERLGVLNPIVVNASASDILVVLDGLKRVEVLRERGDCEVSARIVRMDDEEAEAAILAYNRPHRGLDQLEEAWIIASLARKHGLTQTRIAELVGRHKSWVCRRLALAERLAETIQDDVRLGLLTPTSARELVGLPRGNQAAVAYAVATHGLSSRQVRSLVALYRGADDSARSVLLKDPVPFVGPGQAPQDPPKRDPRLCDSGNKVREALLRLEGAASQFGYVVDRHLPLALEPAQTTVIRPTMTRTKTALAAALDQLASLFEAWEIGEGEIGEGES
ncbi:MAG TPA: ParB/RepB/Spo0J family partition protein [Polyangiaceae bacterium]|nr:ParB/RepB/Spo0J family partition protein [Polyangiaceae bacterium]